MKYDYNIEIVKFLSSVVCDKRILFSNLPLSYICYKFEFTAIVHDVDSFSSTQSELSESSLRLLLAFVCSFKTFAVLTTTTVVVRFIETVLFNSRGNGQILCDLYFDFLPLC